MSLASVSDALHQAVFGGGVAAVVVTTVIVQEVHIPIVYDARFV
jgi:hypothetical protein